MWSLLHMPFEVLKVDCAMGEQQVHACQRVAALNSPKEGMTTPGVEPGLLRPQRKVLTTILSRQLLEGYRNAEANTNFIFFFPKIRKKASPAGNRTPVFRVTGGDTHHYTTEDVAISKSKFTS